MHESKVKPDNVRVGISSGGHFPYIIRAKMDQKATKTYAHFDPKHVLISLTICTNMYSSGIYGYIQTFSEIFRFLPIFHPFWSNFCLILGDFTLNVIYSELSVFKKPYNTFCRYPISLKWSFSIVSYLVALLISFPTSYHCSHQNTWVNSYIR